jgi:hypothetical protein
MEEEDSDEGYTPTMGFADTAGFHDLLERLVRERSEIIKMIEIQKLKVGEATRLLEQNSQLIGRVRGRYSFGTEKVIYSILGFSAIVIVTLSWLTAFHGLPKEVTITFVGTVVGGTIATIAQKLGKVGR